MCNVFALRLERGRLCCYCGGTLLCCEREKRREATSTELHSVRKAVGPHLGSRKKNAGTIEGMTHHCFRPCVRMSCNPAYLT